MFPVRQILIGMTELWTLRWAKSSEFPRFDRTLSSRNFHFILTILADHQVDDKAFQNPFSFLASSLQACPLARVVTLPNNICLYQPLVLFVSSTTLSSSTRPQTQSDSLRFIRSLLISRFDFALGSPTRTFLLFYSCGSTNKCNSSCLVLE